MKKGKRLLVVLLATLVMVIGAFSVTYAATVYDNHTAGHGAAAVTVNDGSLNINCDYFDIEDSDTHYCQLKGAKIELVASDVTYNGEERSATIKYTNASGATGIQSFARVNVGTIHYIGTTAAGKKYNSDTAPIDAGEYEATVTVTITGEAGGPYTVRKSFSIEPLEVTASWQKSSSDTETTLSYVYDSASHVPYAFFSENVIKSRDNVILAVDQSQAQTEAGDNYPVEATVSGDGMYNYSVSGLQTKFTITKAAAVIDGIRWTDPATHVYDGENWAPEAEGKIKGSSPERWIDLTIEVMGSDGAVTTNYKDAGKYTAKATGSADSDYDNVTFDSGVDVTKEFTITPCPISIDWSYSSQYVYNGKPQEPTASVEGTVDDATVTPKVTIDVTNKTTEMKVDGEGYKAGDIKSIHAGDFTARVKKTVLNNDGLVDDNPGLPGVTNYMLEDDSVSALYTIKQKKVDIDWYRPDVDKYGDVVGSDGVKIKDDNTPLNLVYNGKQQAPIAKLKDGELITDSVANGGDPEEDVCTVSVQGPTNAIKVNTDTESYQVQKIGLSNNDYDASEKGRSYNIVPRPVKLEWEHYHDIYNGEKQGTSVTITNPQYKDVVTADTEYPETDDEKGYVRKHFGSDGVDGDEDPPVDAMSDTRRRDPVSDSEIANADGTNIIEEGRTPVDAGLYTIIPGKLSDDVNYTYHTLLIDNAADEVINETDYVELYKTYYMIHQFVVAGIDWSNTTVTYNASYQLPTAKVSADTLKGKDTNAQVEVMIADDVDREEDDFPGYVNAGEYTVFVPHNEQLRGIKGERSMNYLIYEEETENLSSPFVINQAPLKVTAYDKTMSYGDDPDALILTAKDVYYTGLIKGGNPNDKDNVNGRPGTYYDEDEQADMPVVDESEIKLEKTYKKWGKYGTYAIKVSGLSSRNYKITYVPGKLTVRDRILSSELVAKGIAGNKKGTVSWQPVNGAAKYQIYLSLCNKGKKKYTPKLYKTVSASKTSLKIKKLKKYTYYKFYVVALDSNGKRLDKTDQHHFCTNNVSGKYTNPKSIKASSSSVTVNKGASARVTAKVKKVKANKKLTNGDHTKKVRYKTGNPNVATVSANGTITGVGSGWCRVYVMAANGIWQVVEVNVR